MGVIAKAALIALALAPGLLSASELKGLKQKQLVVEPIDNDARECGLSNESIEASARFVLNQSRLRTTKGQTPHFLAFYVTVLRLPNLCVVGYSAKLNVIGQLRTDYGSNDGYFVAWDTGGVLSGPPISIPKRLNDNIEDMTKRFLNAWSKDNQ